MQVRWWTGNSAGVGGNLNGQSICLFLCPRPCPPYHHSAMSSNGIDCSQRRIGEPDLPDPAEDVGHDDALYFREAGAHRTGLELDRRYNVLPIFHHPHVRRRANAMARHRYAKKKKNIYLRNETTDHFCRVRDATNDTGSVWPL